MRFARQAVVVAMVLTALPMPILAKELGVFTGIEVSGGTAHGSSSTRNGGAALAGGGVVENVRFGTTVGIGGHVGYQINSDWSVFLSYEHIRGDIRWDANFPAFGVESAFSGTATSNAILANVGYDFPLSSATTVQVIAGAGVAFNSLSSVVETDKATSIFLSDVKSHTQTNPIAQIGAGIQHEITPNAILGLNATAAYTGGFQTGSVRTGNLGVTEITPYKINNVWRTSIGASAQIRF